MSNEPLLKSRSLVWCLELLVGNHKKVGHLWDLEGAKERLKLVRADLLEEGSFDDAVMACEGVFHTASPIVTRTDSKACKTPTLTTSLLLETEDLSRLQVQKP